MDEAFRLMNQQETEHERPGDRAALILSRLVELKREENILRGELAAIAKDLPLYLEEL